MTVSYSQIPRSSDDDDDDADVVAPVFFASLGVLQLLASGDVFGTI